MRYKKIKQIANTIIDELKLKNNFHEKKILNLSDKDFSGIIEFESSKALGGYEKISSRKGFDWNLLTSTNRIPITEDYTNIYTYLAEIENLKNNEIEYLLPIVGNSDLKITKNSIENNQISLKIINNELYINGINMSLVDFIDLGDSYNNGPKKDDNGNLFKILRTKILLNTPLRVALRIDFEGNWDIISATASLDKNSNFIKFDFNWNNSQKNHLLEVKFTLPQQIKEVFSEDMNTLIKRNFNPNYNIRENLPDKKGLEAQTNTAPMQRGLLIDERENNIGIVTKGLTQYEIYKNNLYIPILRATGVISNPQNPARSTPAGPPIEVNSLQMLGDNKAEFCIFFGNQNAFDEVIQQIYNFIII